MKHLGVEECGEACEKCQNQEHCSPEKKEAQRTVAQILDENVPIYRTMDLLTAAEHLHLAVKEKGLLDFMNEEPRAWVMLFNTIHKIQAAHNVQNAMNLVVGKEMDLDDISKEVGMIENAIIQANAIRFIKSQMGAIRMIMGLGGSGGGPGLSIGDILGAGPSPRPQEVERPEDLINLEDLDVDEDKPN